MAKRIWDTSLFPPLFGKKLESDRQYTVVNTVLPRFPPPLNKVEVHPTLKNFSKVFDLNTQHCPGEGGLLENAQIIE